MTVSEISQIDFTKVWEKERLGLFLNPKISALSDRGMLFLKADAGDEVALYFSCYTYKSWGFRFVITPPGMAYCGLRMVNAPADEVARISLKKEAMIALTAYLLNAYSKAVFDLRFAPSGFDLDNLSGFEVEKLSHTFLDITQPETVLFGQLSSRRKRNIKKQSSGYEIDVNPSCDRVMTVLKHTFEKSNTENLVPFYKAGLSGEPSFLKANLVTLNEQALATNVVAYDGSVAYYFLGGIDPAVNDSNAGTIAMWNAILEAKKAGLKTFNFCGSSIPTISEYFKSFGGYDARLIHIHKGNQLVEKLKNLRNIS